MLMSQSTKYNAGIKLIGDYYDFMNLRETVHYLASDEGIIPTDHSEWLLGLAYELRHAAQKKRDVIKYGEKNDVSTYFSFNTLWPQFLVQVAMLHATAACVSMTREHQANIYRLEYCAESALSQINTEIAKNAMLWLEKFSLFSSDFLIDFISHQSMMYATQEKTAKNRIKNLENILYSFDSIHPMYVEYKTKSDEAAKENNDDAEEFEHTEWSEFKW